MFLDLTLRKATRSARYGLNRLSYRLAGHGSALESLRNQWRGRPALVVGSGPSLKQTPLEGFAGVPAIAMNKINLLFDDVAWRPSLIVCSNPVVMRQNRAFFSSTGIPTYLNWKGRWHLRKRHRRTATFFLELVSDAFSRDITQGVGSSPTVTYVALQFAFYMRAHPVILLGIDHSFIYQGAPNRYVRSTGPDRNHFHPDYFGAGKVWGTPDLKGSERVYRKAREAFEADGREILDATVGGKLRIFPRISVEQALTLCRGPVPSESSDA